MTYTQPLVLLIVIITAVGVVRLRKSRGVWVPAAGLLGLLLITIPASDYLLSRHLEARYPIRPFAGGEAQAIVVLSSNVDAPHGGTPFPTPDKHTYERCEMAAWLYTHWKPLPVVASGGPIAPGLTPLSDTMRTLLLRAGVPEDKIWTEDRSHSTHENAVYSAELLRAKGIERIVLVTEAQSMLRAELAFRKQGLVVLPAPSIFRVFGGLDEELMPSWEAIHRNEITLHETLGLAWYYVRGWI